MTSDSQNKTIRMEEHGRHSIETSATPTSKSPTKQVLITKLVQLLNRQSLHNSGAETLDSDALTLLDAAIEDTKTDMERLRKELSVADSHHSIRQPSEPRASKRRRMIAAEPLFLTGTTPPNPEDKDTETQHPPTQERTHATPSCIQDMEAREASAAPPPFETHSWMIRPVYRHTSPDKPKEQHDDKAMRKQQQQQQHHHQGIVQMRELERDLDLDARIEELERDLDACVEALERDLAATGVS